ncbi:MAG: HAD hydrolase family protein [Dehalococcoidia bacterium]|jgi:beta-phosphoglucomutase-like phosphatase (HAD superfamily)
MATHIFDIDGTIVDFHTNQWLEGAKEYIARLYKQGHQIIFITMRSSKDDETIWSIENTKKTILKDLDDLNIRYTIIFGVQTPRILHDDMPIFTDQRLSNQKYE